MRLGNGAAQTGFRTHPVLSLELSQLSRMSVVHHNWFFVSSEAEPGQQRTRDAAAAKKNCGLHASSAHARSTASTSVVTSLSVCTVEMIQCRPLEGVM